MENGWVIKTGIIEETKSLDVMIRMYAHLASLARQWKNISFEYVDIDKENLKRTLDEGSPEGAEWLFFPCELSLFSVDRQPNSPRMSLAAQATSTYILSATPRKITMASLNFLNMESLFIICLMTSLTFISALMSVINLLLDLKIILTLRNFAHQFYENLWRTSLLFFFEPFVRLLRILSWRILLAVWLIAISFIYIDMCSNLSSKFTKTEYSYIDSVKNLPRNLYQHVFVIRDYVEEGFVNKMAEFDDNYLQLKKQMQRMEEIDLLQLSFTDLVETNQCLILAELIGKIGAKEIFSITSEAPPRDMVSFSEPLYSTFIVFPIARNATSRTVDAINECATFEMEQKMMANFFNEMDFLFFGMRWTKPGEVFQDTSFGDVKSVVDLFVIGSIMACLVFVVEYSTALIRNIFNFYDSKRNKLG